MKNEISIEGMNCQNCAKHTTEALTKLDNVTSVTVNLDQKNAIIESSEALDQHAITAAVTGVGFTVTAINQKAIRQAPKITLQV